MNTILLCVKVEKINDIELYTNQEIYFLLENESHYKLIDVFSDTYNNKLYYYFESKNKINEILLNEMKHKLKEILPNVLYVKNCREKNNL